MAHPMLGRLAARLRRPLGTEELIERLCRAEAELAALRERLESPLPTRPAPVYLGDRTALLATVDDLMMLVDTRDTVVAPTLLLHGLWETTVSDWFRSTLRPGQVFLDVGANVGWFTLLASRLVGDSGEVVALEAHPRLAGLLRRNVILNDLHNVRAFHRAAWCREEELTFHLRAGFAANSSVASLGETELAGMDDVEEQVRVPAISVDGLWPTVAQVRDRPVDVVKVDVEGAELQVFQGMERTLRANPEVQVLFEWSPGQLRMVGTEPGELLDLLAGHQLSFRLVEDGLAPISRDRLLEVRYGNVVAARS